MTRRTVVTVAVSLAELAAAFVAASLILSSVLS